MRMRGGFTLVETLAAMGIIGVLAILLLAEISKWRGVAYKATCANSLRQLGVAAQLYLTEHQQTFFFYSANTAEGKLWYFGLEPWDSVGGPEGSRAARWDESSAFSVSSKPRRRAGLPGVSV